MVARIEDERREREALEQQRQELLKRKQKLIAENKKRKEDLANLDNDLEKFIDVRLLRLSVWDESILRPNVVGAVLITSPSRLRNRSRRCSRKKFESRMQAHRQFYITRMIPFRCSTDTKGAECFSLLSL